MGRFANAPQAGASPLDDGLEFFGALRPELIDEIDQQIAEGKEPMMAILDAAVSRMRPVVLAASTTILGMIPLLPDVFFVNMSLTIMAGLAFATILTLIIVPVLYAILFKVPYRAEA